jgi:hypothetical protein
MRRVTGEEDVRLVEGEVEIRARPGRIVSLFHIGERASRCIPSDSSGLSAASLSTAVFAGSVMQ